MSKDIKNIIKATISEYFNENNNVLIKNDLPGYLYHGSPFKFNKFTTSKMGSGSGEQIDGWGIYLTDNKDAAKLYGNNIYQVTISNNNNNFIDIGKPLDKDLIINILSSLNNNFDINAFNQYYDNIHNMNELKKILWKNLINLDPELKYYTLDEVLNIKYKNSWFYIDNYLENNKIIQNIYNKIMSIPNVDFNDFGFNLNGLGFLFYERLSTLLGGDKKASIFLLNIGVDGLKRIITNNRTDYVVFDENTISIINNTILEYLNENTNLDGYSIDDNYYLYKDGIRQYSSDSKKDLIQYLQRTNPELLNKFNLVSDHNNESNNIITLYRGYGYNEGNNYYSPSKEFALEFTRTGNENELSKVNVNINRIYKHDPLPKGYGDDDPNFNIAIDNAIKKGLNAIWVDEGFNQPHSVFKINPNKKF